MTEGGADYRDGLQNGKIQSMQEVCRETRRAIGARFTRLDSKIDKLDSKIDTLGNTIWALRVKAATYGAVAGGVMVGAVELVARLLGKGGG